MSNTLDSRVYIMSMYFLFLTFATILITIFSRIVTAGALAGAFNLFRPVTCVMHHIIFAVIAVIHCIYIITEIFIDTS